MWKFISNERNEDEYWNEVTETHDKNIQNKKKSTTKTLNYAYYSEKDAKKMLTIGTHYFITAG